MAFANITRLIIERGGISMTGWDNKETFKDLIEAIDFVNDELKFNWLFEYVFEMNSNGTITVYWNDR